MSLLGRKLAYALDTNEYPGKVRVRYVTFSEELIPKSEFNDRTFELVDRDDPAVRQFLKLKDKP